MFGYTLMTWEDLSKIVSQKLFYVFKDSQNDDISAHQRVNGDGSVSVIIEIKISPSDTNPIELKSNKSQKPFANRSQKKALNPNLIKTCRISKKITDEEILKMRTFLNLAKSNKKLTENQAAAFNATQGVFAKLLTDPQRQQIKDIYDEVRSSKNN